MTRTKQRFLSTVLLSALLSGCGFVFPTSPEPQPVAGPEAYRIGTLDGPLADELEEGMQLTAHTGTASDKPIVIAAAALDTITADQVTAINAAYAAREPIVLVYAGIEDIVALQALLGHDSYEYELPDGAPYLEIYAIDQEANGTMWEWTLDPPANTATQQAETSTYRFGADSPETDQTPAEIVSLGYDNDANQDSRAALLIDWIAQDGQRTQASDEQAAKLQVAQASGTNEQLTSLGASFIKAWNFQQSGNNYTVNLFVWRVHSVRDNQDWFYVQQKGIFNGSGAYQTKESRHKGWYLETVEMDACIPAFENKPDTVGLVEYSPQTANNQKQITSGVTWSLGGEVSVDQTNGAAVKLNAGISVNNSTTVSVSDCNVISNCNDKGNNAHWLYQFTDCEVQGTWSDSLSDPPELARFSFHPMNQWVWRMTPEVAARKAPMLQTCTVTLEDDQLNGNWTNYSVKRMVRRTFRACKVPVPYPKAE